MGGGLEGERRSCDWKFLCNLRQAWLSDPWDQGHRWPAPRAVKAECFLPEQRALPGQGVHHRAAALVRNGRRLGSHASWCLHALVLVGASSISLTKHRNGGAVKTSLP